MKCPKCESENTQRLEVAFHGGTQNISTTSNSAGIGIGSGGRIGFGGGVTKTSGQSQSVLAAACAPPAKKSNRAHGIGILLGLWIGMSVFNAEGWVMKLAGIAIIGVVSGTSARLYYSTFQFNSKEWPRLYQYWRESWICHKCGGIYHQA